MAPESIDQKSDDILPFRHGVVNLTIFTLEKPKAI
jgi:hypothetical protein